jgi:hypothetical protein
MKEKRNHREHGGGGNKKYFSSLIFNIFSGSPVRFVTAELAKIEEFLVLSFSACSAFSAVNSII